MTFSVKDLEELIEKVRVENQTEKIQLVCPPGLKNDFMEYWSKDKLVDVVEAPRKYLSHYDYGDDKIWVIPIGLLEKRG